MSLTSDFLKAMNQNTQTQNNRQKNKKRQEFTGGDEFTRTYLTELSKLQESEVETRRTPITVGSLTMDAPIAPLKPAGTTTSKKNGETATSEKKDERVLGSTYLTGGVSDTSSPYAAGLQDTKAIAPTKGEEETPWYQSGLFADGYDFGDVTKTILGINEDSASLLDLTWNSAKRGFYNARLGEESYDALMGSANEKEKYEQILAGEEYQFTPGNDLASGVSGSFEQIGQLVRQFTNPRTVAFTGAAAGAAAIAGQAGPQVLLPEEIITVPAATIAAFSAGSATANMEIEAGLAYNEMLEAGITEETARKVALGVGGVNAGLELLQVDELLDAYKVVKGSGTTKSFASRILEELVDRGIDVATETAQEVAQEGVTIAGVQAANKIDNGEWAYNAGDVASRLLDTAKSSALTFGTMNVPATVRNTVTIAAEQNAENKLTSNERAVVDKIVEDRVAEAEEKGETVSKKQIYNDVLEAMDKGYISTDVIEEVLGGEEYNRYKQAAEWEDSLQNEYDTLSKEYDDLYNMKGGEKSSRDADREAELKNLLPGLKKRLDNVKATSTLSQMKEQLGKNVFESIKGDRLAESYHEQARAFEDFKPDYDKFKDKKFADAAKKTIDSAIALEANNTNRVRDLVEFAAGVAGDTGQTITFKTGEQVTADFITRQEGEIAKLEKIQNRTAEQEEKLTDLKELLEQVKSGEVIIDGDISGDGIVLNLGSQKPLNRVVGHEITHSFEGNTEEYKKLKDSLFAYAESKGIDIKAEIKRRAAQYAGVTDADPEAELVADLIGDYLFTDRNYVKKLSTENLTGFKWLFNEIKHLCKLATAGSKEARELERVRKIFADIYREGSTKQSNTKLSISDSNGKKLSAEQAEYFKDSKMRDENGNLKVMYHGSQDAGFHVFDPSMSDDGISLFFVDRNDVAASYSGTSETYEAKAFKTVDDANKFFAEAGNADVMEKAESLKKNLDSQYVALVKDLSSHFAANHYDTPEAAAKAVLSNKEFAEISIQVGMPSDLASRINEYFDLAAKEKSARIEARKADNDIWKYKVIEKDGEYTLLYDGDEIATSKDLAELYEEFCEYEGVGYGDANYKVYLNLTNPLEVDVKGRNWNNVSREFSQEIADRYHSLTTDEKAALTNLAEWGEYSIFRDEMLEARATAEQGGSGVFDEAYTKTLASAYEKLGGANTNLYDAFSIASENFSEEAISQFAVKQMNTRDYAKKAKAEGYDGVIFKNIHDNGGYSNGSEGASTVAIAFDSNQIKSTANTNPTKDMDIRYSMSSISNSFFGDENMTSEEFRKKDYRETQGYKDYVDQCLNNIRQSRKDFDETSARKEIEDSIEGIVKVAIAAKMAGYDIQDTATRRNAKDSKKRLLFSSLEPNSEYLTSHDISTICDKRKNFAEIYDEIVKAEEAKGVPREKRFFSNVDNYFYLHKLMADKGLTQPCRQCYVESMRKNLAPMANAFLRLVGETNPNNTANDQLYHQSGKTKGELKTSNAATREWVLVALDQYGMSVNDLTVETLTTEDGLAQLKIQAPMVYEAFNSFYGQSKPKMPKSATPFRFGELTALLTDEKGRIKKSLVDKINSTGGFRLQSYSDFQIQNYTDVLQVIFEAGTLGLNGHAYTKVPAFLDATTGTNLKRNISIFMYKDGDEWKLDRNDSFPYTLEEIYEIVKNDKTGNTGIIAVSQNAEMSAWIMANDLVGYGIPFHKSGLKMGTVRDTIVREDGREIKGYSGTKDHTKQQTEVWAKAAEDHKALTKVKKGINIYSFWDFDNKANLSKNELIEKNVKAYIDACEMAGYLPKFREYVMNNSKVLSDVLKYSKELGYVAQDATIEDISFEYKGYRIPYGYYKFLGDFGMFTPDGQASPQKTLSLNNYDFDKAAQFFYNSETLRRNEILQQFANGEERQKYRDSNLTAEQLTEIVKQKRKEVAEGVISKKSLSAKGEEFAPIGDFDFYGQDFQRRTIQETAPDVETIAPAQETVQETATENATAEFPDDLAPMAEEAVTAQQSENVATLTDADMPPENEPYYGEPDAPLPPSDPFEDRDFDAVGDRKVKAYMYENPEVKPFFQAEANVMLGELRNSTKGGRLYNDELYDKSGGEEGWSGVKRNTSEDIAYLLDKGYSYAEIEKGLNAIIEDNGKENIAIAKRIEFLLNDRLFKGYTDFDTGMDIPPDQDYINLVNEKRISEYSEDSYASLFESIPDDFAPVAETAAPAAEDIAPVAYEAIRPKREPQPKLIRVNDANARPGEKQRKWVGTSTESEVVNREILPDDLDQNKIFYQPIPNKVTLGKANAMLDRQGYEQAITYFNSKLADKRTTLEDIALGERLIQEAMKRGDTKTAGELIQNVAILGTELGQKVQALSIIQRMTPEGQLKMLQKTLERGKAKGDKAYEGVELTQDLIDHILKTYGKDGSYDQDQLNQAVEDVKQKIADQMNVSALDKVNAWRYLSMLGNPKTHIRNLVSNIAMQGTVNVKNAVARTIESIAPISNRTKTWKAASDEVKNFAKQTAEEMKEILMDGGKYSEDASIKEKRDTFKNKILNGLYEFNSDLLSKEDWWFSKPAFTSALSEYLTANGIVTAEDIRRNKGIVEKAKLYATEQSQIATFRQYSWLANKINDIERHNVATNIAVGSILPFKKTPINIARTGLNYSPLGFAKTLTYDASKVKNGEMEASTMIDHLAQNVTGSALTLIGYMLASAGFLNGSGDDDKEGKYDYQLGKQGYSVTIGDATYSLSWLSPVAMPLFVGANAYEQLVEDMEWNGDVVVQTLAQTLDPLSEMSFLSSLDSVLSSYDSGIQKFMGIFETAAQDYITQFVPTLSSQVATVFDDTKRTTKVAGDSDFKAFDTTINNLMYKIPGLRNMLEPSTDIWGNEIKQSDNLIQRAFETFIAPYARREDISTSIDSELKDLYRQTGDNGVIPSIPYNYTNFDGVKYEMSAEEYTTYKETYGQTAYDLMADLFRTNTYRNADSETRAEMVNMVFDYARDEAKRELLDNHGVDYTNATEDGEEYYKENSIVGAIEYDVTPEEYEFMTDEPEKYSFFKENGISYETYANADEDEKRAYSWAYDNPGKFTMSKAISDDFLTYYQYRSDCNDFDAKDANGNTVNGLKKRRVRNYIFSLDIDYGAQAILFRSMYDSAEDKEEYNWDIVNYLNSRDDISFEEMRTILIELDFEVDSQGNISW